MKTVLHRDNESGMALVTTLMVLMLMSALMVGFFAAISTDQRANGIDRDQTQAYAAAHAGLEKLTSDLSGLFESDFSPSAVQINALTGAPPVVSGFQYTAPGGATGSGYAISFAVDNKGNPAPADLNGTVISSGPYQGFRGIITPYSLTVTARSNSGGAEVRLRRQLETVSVPVFQFGMFSETDLSFFAGPDFDFGGRIQTNGNLYLAEGDGTLTLADRVTAAGEIIRRELSNGLSARVNSNYQGVVRAITALGTYRDLALTEGSVVDGMGPPTSSYTYAQNEPKWTNLSVGTYKSNIRSGRTGGKRLNLPLATQGATPVDLIRRPAQNSNENIANPLVFGQRYFASSSLRILLSDTALDILQLPTITPTAPVPLDGTATAAQYGPTTAANNTALISRPPLATSPGPLPQPLMATTAATANGATVILSNNITANFPAQVLSVGGVAVTCTGRDLTNFYGCTNPLPITANNAAVTGNVTMGGIVTVASTNLTQSINAARSVLGKITVNSTAAFGPMVPLIWVNLAAPASPMAVTCLGADNNPAGAASWLVALTRLNQCSGVNAAIPNATPLSTNALASAGQNLIGGFIKIEVQNVAGVWTDVTTEILNLGIAGADQMTATCTVPSSNAVIRLQRLRDNADDNCYYQRSINANDYWPNMLYDTREGNLRDTFAANNATVTPGGAMGFVELDVLNLKRWLAGTIGVTGTTAVNNNGFVVYFSDRRGNRNTGVAVPAVETGEYGFEDVVNPADILGVPNGNLDAGEDVGGTVGPLTPNADGLLQTYGQTPVNLPAGNAAPLNANTRPWSTVVGGVNLNGPMLMVNRPIFFRRALKLINGGVNGGASNLPSPGLTVAAENPVYIDGNYNATSTNVTTNVHVASAILADAVTLLSNNWTDVNSFWQPNTTNFRMGTTTGYRVAIAAGKTASFKKPTWNGAADDFGTDGGAHNFLRYLENWGGSDVNYNGSLVSLYNSRQAVGTYKCCTNVYSPPDNRNYRFDTDFLTPSLLPPGTPMFRDIDTLTFRQLLRPTE